MDLKQVPTFLNQIFNRKIYLFCFLIFKLCEMVLLFNSVTDLFTGFFLVWGLLILLWDFAVSRNFLNYKGSYLLIVFLALTGITALLNFHEGFYVNIVIAARLTIFFLVIYPIFYCYNRDEFLNLLYHIAFLVMVFFLVVSAASIIIFYSNQRFMYYAVNSLIQVRLGMQSGSFFGYLGSSTSAAFCSIIAIYCTIIVRIINRTKPIRLLCFFSFLLQFFVLSIYNARGGYLCMAFFAAGLVFFLCMRGDFFRSLKIKKGCRRFFVAVGVSVGTALIVFTSFMLIRSVIIDSSSLVQLFRLNMKEESASDITYEQMKESIQETTVRSDYQEDVSNSRFFLWKTQLQTVRENPFLGVGTANVATNFYRHIDQNQTRDYTRLAPNAHNTYLQVLVTNGIVGFVVMAGFLLFIIWKGFQLVFKEYSDKSQLLLSVVLCTAFCTYLCNGLFEYFFFTQQSVMNVMFLVVSSGIVYLCDYADAPIPENNDIITKVLLKMRKQK